MKRKPIPKKIREQVYSKYDGHCAYCGCELEYKDMQVDHIDSVYKAEIHNKEANDEIDNYMPSCRAYNFYKSTFSTEQFGERLSTTLIDNLHKGLVREPVKFYYERRKNK